MNSQKFWLLIVTVMIVTAVLHMPSIAQEPLPDGTLTTFRATTARTAEELNLNISPFFCSKTDDSFGCLISQNTTIDLIGADYNVGWYMPNIHGALAESWEFSENNTVLTIQLRDDLKWSDGMPITAEDVILSYELSLRPESNMNGEDGVRELESVIQDVDVLDAYTLRITFQNTECNAVANVNELEILPSHIYRPLIEEVGYAGLRDHERVRFPDVVSGPFIFDSIDEQGNVTLRRNERYTDNELGYVGLNEYVWLNVHWDDIGTIEPRFLDGEFSWIYVSSEALEVARDVAEQGLVQLFSTQSTSSLIMNLNQADPTNPQPAVDENGVRIDQGIHPIFGDKLVRQGFARAIDYQRILDEVYMGGGQRVSAHTLPGSWAENPTLEPIPYDPDTALSLLAEAGWVPENPALPASSDNRLVCLDCLYAREIDPDFNGSYLDFELLVASGNTLPNAVAQIIISNLTEIGITVQFPEQVWDVVLERLLNQTYDATLNGLIFGYPNNPSTDDYYSVVADAPGTGLNMTSFYNEAYFALESTAQTVPGCGITERAAIYHQMQEILHEEMPAIYLTTNDIYYVVQNNVVGIDPRAVSITWNIDTWRIIEDE